MEPEVDLSAVSRRVTAEIASKFNGEVDLRSLSALLHDLNPVAVLAEYTHIVGLLLEGLAAAEGTDAATVWQRYSDALALEYAEVEEEIRAEDDD